MKSLKGYKTLIFNGATLAAMLLAALTGQITDPNILKGIAIGQAVVNVVLRFITDSPVMKDSSK